MESRSLSRNLRRDGSAHVSLGSSGDRCVACNWRVPIAGGSCISDICFLGQSKRLNFAFWKNWECLSTGWHYAQDHRLGITATRCNCLDLLLPVLSHGGSATRTVQRSC